MIFILCLILHWALLGYEQPKKYWYLTPVTFIAFILDVIICFTTWRLISGPIEKSEWTISQTLERLCKIEGLRKNLFIEIAKEINRQSPSGKHIPLE